MNLAVITQIKSWISVISFQFFKDYSTVLITVFSCSTSCSCPAPPKQQIALAQRSPSRTARGMVPRTDSLHKFSKAVGRRRNWWLLQETAGSRTHFWPLKSVAAGWTIAFENTVRDWQTFNCSQVLPTSLIIVFECLYIVRGWKHKGSLCFTLITFCKSLCLNSL